MEPPRYTCHNDASDSAVWGVRWSLCDASLPSHYEQARKVAMYHSLVLVCTYGLHQEDVKNDVKEFFAL